MKRRTARSLLWAVFAAASLPLSASAEFRSVSEDAAILYDAPSAQSKKLFVVNQGYPLEIIVMVEGWLKVRDANGSLTWVEAKQVAGKQRTVMVKAAVAQIRQNADDSSPVVFQAQQNVILDLVEVAGGWLRVRHRDGQSGYVKVAQVWGV